MDVVKESAKPKPTELSLEERRFARETELRLKELALKEREVMASEIELKRSRWLNPTVIGLFAAALGLVGNLVVASIGNRNAQQVEHSRAQSSLIIQAVSTGDATRACKNLVSFIKLGLLDDPQGTIGRCESSPQNIPVLPSNTKIYVPQAENNLLGGTVPLMTSIDSGDEYEFDVKWSIPKIANSDDIFNSIQVYAYKVDQQGIRSGNITLPTIHGSWNVGETVFFSTHLPKSYVDDSSKRSYLRFCIVTADHCYPSPNLLVPSK